MKDIIMLLILNFTTQIYLPPSAIRGILLWSENLKPPKRKRGIRLKRGVHSLHGLRFSRSALLEIGDTRIWHIRDPPLGIAQNSCHKARSARQMDTISNLGDVIGKKNLRPLFNIQWLI